MRLKPAVVVGLIFFLFLIIVSLVLFLTFKETLSSLNVELSSQIPKYQLSLNNKVFFTKRVLLRHLYRNKGINLAYDRGLEIKGFNISLAEVGIADPFFPQDKNFMLNAFDTSGYDFVNEPVGGHVSNVDEDSKTLFMRFWLHPESLKQGQYSDEALAIWINARVFTFIDLITKKNIGVDIEQIEEPLLKFYTEKMTVLSKNGNLPILIKRP